MANVVNSGKTRGAKQDEPVNLGWLNFKVNSKAGVKSFSARAGIPINDDNEVGVLLVQKLNTFATEAEKSAFLMSVLQVTFTEASAPIDNQTSLWD